MIIPGKEALIFIMVPGLRFLVNITGSLPAKKSDMIVLGIDFRKYIRIHRELIWANRFAASTSFGPTKLIYYLGGVDNWMGYLFNKIPMFDNTIPVTPNVNYGFQALATNMRGFSSECQERK